MKTRPAFLVLMALLLARLACLGVSPLLDPTEGRYAGIPRRMLLQHQWVMPYLDDGRPFWSKPPLHFWWEALCMKIFGLTEFAARLPSFLGALLTLALVYALARRWRGPEAALWSVLLLASTACFFFISGFVLTEMTLALCVTAAMVSLSFSLLEKDAIKRTLYQYGFFAALGLGMLAKGPIAMVLGVGAVLVAAWLARSTALLKKIPWVSGFLLSGAIFAPWLWLAEKRTPGFLHYYIVNEHFRRFTQPQYGDLYGPSHPFPRGMILVFCVVAALPWPLLYFKAARAAWKARARRGGGVHAQMAPETLCLGWIIALLGFYTLSRTVVVTYVLPCLPAFALLGGAYFEKKLARVSEKSAFFWSALCVVPVLCLLFSILAGPLIGAARSTRALARQLRAQNDFGAAQIAFYDKMPYSADFYFKRPLVDLNHNAGKLEKIFQEHQKTLLITLNEDEAFIPAWMLKRTGPPLLSLGRFTVYGCFMQHWRVQPR